MACIENHVVIDIQLCCIHNGLFFADLEPIGELPNVPQVGSHGVGGCLLYLGQVIFIGTDQIQHKKFLCLSQNVSAAARKGATTQVSTAARQSPARRQMPKSRRALRRSPINLRQRYHNSTGQKHSPENSSSTASHAPPAPVRTPRKNPMVSPRRKQAKQAPKRWKKVTANADKSKGRIVTRQASEKQSTPRPAGKTSDS